MDVPFRSGKAEKTAPMNEGERKSNEVMGQALNRDGDRWMSRGRNFIYFICQMLTWTDFCVLHCYTVIYSATYKINYFMCAKKLAAKATFPKI